MTIKGGGNQWQKAGFSVFMGSNTETKYAKCLKCRLYKSPKCKTCKKHSKFEDRGFVLIDKRKYE